MKLEIKTKYTCDGCSSSLLESSEELSSFFCEITGFFAGRPLAICLVPFTSFLFAGVSSSDSLLVSSLLDCSSLVAFNSGIFFFAVF